ncbi:hypothetical protein AFL01nite_08500 [Aeromicrobium flavum]|uniref:Uncharacterized protein n=1 Tax=Aeromicrobium flavum TaxID=416568 RepID=A0A512HST4_9ACTN|nr:hypothetical protein AFL01nite_08500 [Aeromicrobium flavum]
MQAITLAAIVRRVKWSLAVSPTTAAPIITRIVNDMAAQCRRGFSSSTAAVGGRLLWGMGN